MYSLNVKLHGSFLEPLATLGWAVGPVTWGGVLVRGSLWLWPGCSVQAAGQGKTQPLPSPSYFLPPLLPC